MHKIWRVVIALVFLVVGLAGLVLPIIPGILFLILGFLVLSTVYEPAAKVFEKLSARHPELHKRVAQWRDRWFPEPPNQQATDVSNEK